MTINKILDNQNSKILINPNLNEEEFRSRDIDYINDNNFSYRRNLYLFNPVDLIIDNKKYIIQYNYCDNPLCKWYGTPQEKGNGKTLKYKLDGDFSSKSIHCTDINISNLKGVVLNDFTIPVSNWSVALEIKRLIDINSFEPLVNYEFHKESCSYQESTVFNDRKQFHKWTKNKNSKGERYRCKACHKITTILPSQEQDFTYHQKVSNIVHDIASDHVTKKSVRGAIAKNIIGSSTYYHKTEHLYLKCLEFLASHEYKKLKKRKFDELWISTDKLEFVPNFQRKKGHGGINNNAKKPQFSTFIVNSIENQSNYVFRSDLAYDYNINIKELMEEIESLHEDKLVSYQKKYDQYSIPDFKISGDFQPINELDKILQNLSLGYQYHDGLHVQQKYTQFAHYWLLDQILNCDNLNLITDNDPSTKTALTRIFESRIKNKKANIFICTMDKKLSRSNSSKISSSKKYIIKKNTAVINELFGSRLTTEDYSLSLLEEKIINDGLYEKNLNGYPVSSKKIEHPLPSEDEGERTIFCLNDLTHLDSSDIAKLLYKVNTIALNGYHTELRREINLLERPIAGSRGEGKDYRYAPKNLKNVQYLLTIYRAYHNFCKPIGNTKQTPAMKLGIANKQYTLKDIIYYRG